MSKDIKERFWSKVDIKGDDECWNWNSAKRNKKEGYGAFWMDGRHHPAQRIALILSGKYEDGFLVCHKCDNPSCCNPNHLFLGSHKDNMNDKKTKLRSAGSKNSFSKLTELDVKNIREVIKKIPLKVKD